MLHLTNMDLLAADSAKTVLVMLKALRSCPPSPERDRQIARGEELLLGDSVSNAGIGLPTTPTSGT